MRSFVRFSLGVAGLLAGTAACTAILGVDELPLSDEGASTEAGAPDASLGDAAPRDGAGGDAAGDAADGSLGDGMTASFDGGPVSDGGSIETATNPFVFQPLPGLQSTSADLRFGASVAMTPSLDGGVVWIAIGAPGAGEISTGESTGRGNVQVVRLTAGTEMFTYGTFLLNTRDTAKGSAFGSAVAFSPDGRFLAVGAPSFPAGGSTTQTGAVFLFIGENGGWRYLNYVTVPSDSPTSFGSALAFMVPPNLPAGVVAELLVGAPGPADRSSGGKVYLYRVTDSIIADAGADEDAGDAGLVFANEQVTHGTAPPGDGFGASLAASLDGTVILVGAPFGDKSAGGYGGFAYVTANASFTDAAALVPAGPIAGGEPMYGTSVALTSDGHYAAIGGPVNGVAELRTLDAAAPMKVTNRYSIAPDSGAGDGGAGFGTCVAVTSSRVYAGAPLDPPTGNVVGGEVNGTVVANAARLVFSTLLGTAGLGTACAANEASYFVVSAPGTGAPAVYIFH